MKWLQGQFLVASPHLADPNFYRSVVLMVQHNEQGAFGLILNRPTNQPLKQVWETLAGEECDHDHIVGCGGPVDGPLTALHSLVECGECEVCPGVYFSSEEDAIRAVLQNENRSFGLFAGYAGWGSGQLEGEMEVGGWLTTPASAEVVFSNPDDLWDRIVRKIGLDILSPSINSKHVPQDPNLN